MKCLLKSVWLFVHTLHRRLGNAKTRKQEAKNLILVLLDNIFPYAFHDNYYVTQAVENLIY